MRGGFCGSHSLTVLPSQYSLACWCSRKRTFGLCRCSPHDGFTRTRGGRYLQCCRSPLAVVGGSPASMEEPVRIDQCNNIRDFRLMARRVLPTPIFHYLDGAADDEITYRRVPKPTSDAIWCPTFSQRSKALSGSGIRAQSSHHQRVRHVISRLRNASLEVDIDGRRRS